MKREEQADHIKREAVDDLLDRLEGKKPCWVSETMKEAAELIREFLAATSPPASPPGELYP